jgi:putative transposase
MFHSVRAVDIVAVNLVRFNALPDSTEHESTGKLLYQQSGGEIFRSLKSEWGFATGSGSQAEAHNTGKGTILRPHGYHGGLTSGESERLFHEQPGRVVSISGPLHFAKKSPRIDRGLRRNLLTDEFIPE